ncbi:MAG: sulfatase-like hydrolase/transferase, partial [Sedimentisphaerales bacterium]|nr:sulfatase-like hydrolase/transferase [Sedimentisphaerales bacterium]
MGSALFSRRQVLTAVGMTVLGLHASVGPGQGNPARRRPSFVFFLVDDLGWKDLGCFGSMFYETPNIDRLAAQGMRFTNA